LQKGEFIMGTSTDTVQSIDLIVTNPRIRGGRPCVLGTGIRVTDLVMASLFHQRSPDQIASDFDITLAQTYAALAYYYQHKEVLDQDIKEQIRLAQQLKLDHNRDKSPLLS
jgi:uncharacterized protein (DUF433 family)